MRSLSLAPVSLVLASFAVVSLAPLSAGCARPSRDARSAAQAPAAPSRDGVPDGTSVPKPGPGDQGGGVRVFSSSGGAVCGDDLAATTFRFAVCVCEDAAFAADVETSSFSSSDPSAPIAGGGLGANGSISAAGSLAIGGSLAAGGDVTPAGSMDVRDDLRAGGDVAFVGAGAVGGDAFVAGDVTAIGLQVGGTLHANEASRLIGVGADVVREPVSIDPPCTCGDDQRTDVVGIVAAARSDNDNASNAIDAASLRDVVGDVELSLPAGRFLFDGVRAAGAVRIAVSGPAAVFIDGDLALAGALEVILDGADASLDLFILGDLAAAGALDIGSATSPAKVRVYVGGDGDIAIAGSAALGASLFAPAARVALAGAFTFDGALVVGSIAQAGTLTVRYDADVLGGAGLGCDDDVPAAPDSGSNDGSTDPGVDPGSDGDGVTDPGDVGGGACDTSADCGNQACIDGSCGACASDLDCAAPLSCLGGACIPLSG